MNQLQPASIQFEHLLREIELRHQLQLFSILHTAWLN
eukprot:UN20586